MAESARVRVPGGAEVEVRTEGTGEPLLLIQTALAPDELVPLSQEKGIAGRFRVIDCRRRGYGTSSPVAGSGSVARDAADCLAVLHGLEAVPAHVLGASYSGAVALELAARAPGAVRTLTVIEPPPAHGPPADDFFAANRRLLAAFEGNGVTMALEEFTRVLGTPSWLDERERADPVLVRKVEQDATTFFRADVPALLTWRFEPAQAAAVNCPVMYIGGAASHPWFTHVHAWIKELFPGTEDHLIAGAGHSVASTHSSTVGALVAAFLSRNLILS